jgi:hypothetical protein
MKKTSLYSFLLSFIFMTSHSLASVVTSQDTAAECTIYRTTSPEAPAQVGEQEVDPREVYGFSLINMTVDFDAKLVRVDMLKRVVLGFDRVMNEKPLTIKQGNPNFLFLINHLNRDLHIFEKFCLTADHELAWASLFKTQK